MTEAPDVQIPQSHFMEESEGITGYGWQGFGFGML